MLYGQANDSSLPEVCKLCIRHKDCFAANITNYNGYSIQIHSHVLQMNEHVFHRGDEQKAIYVVKSGSLKSYISNKKGDEQVLNFHVPGDILSIEGLTQNNHESSAIALQTSTLCVLPIVQLETMLENLLPPWLISFTMKKLNQDIRNQYLLGKRNAKSRLAAFLLEIAADYKAIGYSDREFNLTMSREDIGNYLGIAPETVSRTFTRMQKVGVLKMERRHITILDGEQLGLLAVS